MDRFERILLRLVVLHFELLLALSPSGCLPRADGDGGLSRAQAFVAVIDADEDTWQPALPDSLAKGGDSGSSGAAGRGSEAAIPHDADSAAPEQKPVGTVWARYCPVCPEGIKFRRDIAKYKGLRFVLIETGDNPMSLTWIMRGKTHTVSGWIDLPTFIARYNASLKLPHAPAPVATAHRPLLSNQSDSAFTWPGDLRRHLVAEHGLERYTVDRWTDAECIAWHDVAHRGKKW